MISLVPTFLWFSTGLQAVSRQLRVRRVDAGLGSNGQRPAYPRDLTLPIFSKRIVCDRVRTDDRMAAY